MKITRNYYDLAQKELEEICDNVRGKQIYDCIVPASGGKDSTYVADKMKNEFNTIFTNDVSGESTISDISKNKNDKDLVYTEQKITERENDKYNIVANIPYINIDSNIVGKINSDINKKYIDKIEKIIAESKEYQDYNVTYKAYINGELLSIIIKENIKETKETQNNNHLKEMMYIIIYRQIYVLGFFELLLIIHFLLTDIENINKLLINTFPALFALIITAGDIIKKIRK